MSIKKEPSSPDEPEDTSTLWTSTDVSEVTALPFYNKWDIKFELEDETISRCNALTLAAPGVDSGEDWKISKETVEDTKVMRGGGNFRTRYSQSNQNTERKGNKAPPVLQCDMCGATYDSKMKIYQHIAGTHERNYAAKIRTSYLQRTCVICHKVFNYKYWHYHVKNVHSKKNNWKCVKCHMSFKCKKYLLSHQRNVHCDEQRNENEMKSEKKCPLCPKVFKSQDNVGHHIKNVHSGGGKTFRCSICPSELKSAVYLRAHVRRVHYDDGKQHPCDICGKSFKSPRYLNKHRRNRNHL